MAVLKAIVSLYRAGGEKPIERYKTGVKVGVQENKLFSSFQKKILSSYLGSTRRAQNGKPGHTNLLIKAQ